MSMHVFTCVKSIVRQNICFVTGKKVFLNVSIIMDSTQLLSVKAYLI